MPTRMGPSPPVVTKGSDGVSVTGTTTVAVVEDVVVLVGAGAAVVVVDDVVAVTVVVVAAESSPEQALTSKIRATPRHIRTRMAPSVHGPPLAPRESALKGPETAPMESPVLPVGLPEPARPSSATADESWVGCRSRQSQP